ncbi:MAG TPA: TetR/AcrR family transcriptional regulator [Ktedonobacteraceae bacterium]|nr:TetR/AcrR family transcriptional regulator [Ktedonobacteraceae bacterium]
MNTRTIRDTRREEIIGAARDLFSRKGFHGTSMPDIAHAAGISTGLIYYIFASKEDILLACCEEVATLHLDLFNQANHITDPLERFDYIVRELYRSLDEGSKRLIIMYRDSSTLPHETRWRMLDMIKNLDNRFLMLFEEGQRAGVFRPDILEPRVLAANVLGLGHLWSLHKTWHFAPDIDLETYTSAQLDYFHAQLLPRTGAKAPSDQKSEI